MVKMDAHDKFMLQVGSKINAARKDLLARANGNQKNFAFTAERIRKSSENLFFNFGEKMNDPVKAIYKGFSEKPGIQSVGNVNGVDVVDINIMATTQSVLGYISAERGSDKPTDTLWLQGLKSASTTENYAKGEWVNHPYTPLSKKIRNAIRGAVVTVDAKANDKLDLETLGGAVAHGNVLTDTIQFVNSTTNKVIGKYVDGELLFNVAPVATLADGVITVTSACKVVAGVDKTSEKDGAHTLKVKPATDTINVVNQPRRIQLEQSYEDNSYMNKQNYGLAKAGVVLDYGQMAVNQLLDTYVKFLDFDSCMTTAESAFGYDPADTLDLTDYLLATSEARTKNDIVKTKIMQTNKKLQQLCGFGATYILVDSEGAVVLGADADNFVSNPTFDQNLDGVVGTYRGIPVIRHHSIDGAFDTETETTGVAILGYKAPDGSLASTIFSEYIAPYSVSPALDFDNPASYSTGLYSMSACTPIDEQVDFRLCTWLKFITAKTE